MKKYEVDFTDAKTGATSAIDTITAPDDYTAEQYEKDCADNDVYWGDGTFTLVVIGE